MCKVRALFREEGRDGLESRRDYGKEAWAQEPCGQKAGCDASKHKAGLKGEEWRGPGGSFHIAEGRLARAVSCIEWDPQAECSASALTSGVFCLRNL